jgi:hypothetical protein
MTLGILDYVVEFILFFFAGLAILFSPLNPHPIDVLD